MTSPSYFEVVFPFLVQNTHLRYEITFTVGLLVLWGLGYLAGFRLQQKPRDSAKLASPSSMNGKQVNSPASVTATSQHQPPLRINRGKRIFWKGSVVSTGQSTATSRSGRRSKGDNADSMTYSASRMGHSGHCDADLTDLSQLVYEVIGTRRGHADCLRALREYRAAREAGLELHNVPVDDCKQFFSCMVISAIHAQRMDDALEVLRDRCKYGLGADMGLFTSILKLCMLKHLVGECLSIYDFMAEDPDFVVIDKSIWSRLLFCAMEVKAFGRCTSFFDRLKTCGAPSHRDYGIMVRLAGLQLDWQLSLSLVKDMRDVGVDKSKLQSDTHNRSESVIYNSAVATCIEAGQTDHARNLLEEMESSDGLADVISYNSVMKAYAKMGCMEECFQVFELLKKRSIKPSQVTYGILLNGLLQDNQLSRAAEVLTSMSSEGHQMNAVLYTIMIKGFAQAGELDRAMKVFEQMNVASNVRPDLITFTILIKANCDTDRLDDGIKLLQTMLELDLHPDEVVFNNLIAGCARQTNAKLGTRLYNDMVAAGLRPSNATFSIMIRLFHQCKLLNDAVEMIRNEPGKYNVDLEPRLFLQLISACIRERQGRQALDSYKILIEQAVPTASAHGIMITNCTKFKMYDTATEILAIAASRGFKVESKDANALLESAAQRHRMEVVELVAASMAKLGLCIEPKIISFLEGRCSTWG